MWTLFLGLLMADPIVVERGKLSTYSATAGKLGPLARYTHASSYGIDLATRNATADWGDGKIELGGTTLKLVDSLEREGYAVLSLVSGSQVNWLVPDWVANGDLQLTLFSGAGVQSTGKVVIEDTAPGLYSATRNARGAPPALIRLIGAEGGEEVLPLWDCGTVAGSCVPVHVDPSSGAAVEIVVNGSGIRAATSLSARIGNEESSDVRVEAHPEVPGLDRVTIRVPSSLAASGTEVGLSVVADGKSSEPVQILTGPPALSLGAIEPASVTADQKGVRLRLRGSGFARATSMRFVPSEGVTVTRFTGSDEELTAEMDIAKTPAVGERRLCVNVLDKRSNCLPFTITAGSTPIISNLSFGWTLSGSTVGGASGSFDFADGDADITSSGSRQGSAQLVIEHLRDTRFSGRAADRACLIQAWGGPLHRSGQTSGKIEFSLTFSGSAQVTINMLYSDVINVWLVDAGGRQSNILSRNTNYFVCPSNAEFTN